MASFAAASRLASARALAERAGAVLVLEGDGCVVAAPGGPVALGTAASGALAANGTGSVLAGLVGTFLARGMDPFAAAAAAVLARSDAGNVAATHVGAGHTVAGDVIQALPEALAPRRDQAPSHDRREIVRLWRDFLDPVRGRRVSSHELSGLILALTCPLSVSRLCCCAQI